MYSPAYVVPSPEQDLDLLQTLFVAVEKLDLCRSLAIHVITSPITMYIKVVMFSTKLTFVTARKNGPLAFSFK